MQKTIRIDGDKAVKLSANFKWLYVYRNQFGVDVLPKLIPALNAAAVLFQEIAKKAGAGASAAEIMAALPVADIQDAFIELAGLELVDVFNIVWSMAKAADGSIDDPEEWVDQFDTFPLDVILPEVFNLVAQSSISTKNLKGLGGQNQPTGQD